MNGIASDGDERLLSAMKSRTRLDLTTETNLSQLFIPHPINVQDTIHIATKLRNRYLNTTILLQMGNMVVTVAHVIMMLSEVPKEVHGLVLSDVCPDDRQNFSSFEKITQDRVIQSLKGHIADSKATVMYLVLCRQISSSFLDNILEPIERVYRIWNAVYFFRCWRKWIKSPDNEFSLDQNFLSRNAYTCVELNAHSLIHLIINLRHKQQNEFFLPHLFSSQACEQTFRNMRSLGTANYTKINFTLHELLHMIARVEMMNKIMYTTKEITFPRIELKSQIVKPRVNQIAASNTLPNDEDIINAMKRAQRDALKSAAEFGMHFDENDIIACELKLNYQKTNLNEETLEETAGEEDWFDFLEQSMAFGENNSEGGIQKFVEVIDPDGSTRRMRKSTFVWLLCESKDKLSSDRLRRVQSGSENAQPKHKKLKPNPEPNTSSFLEILSKEKELEVGEWAIFELSSEESAKNIDLSEHNFMKNYLIGVVVGFTLASKTDSGELRHQKQLKCKYIKTDSKDLCNKNDIRVLCVWYTCDQTGTFQLVQNKKQNPIYVSNYVATMKKPITRKCESSGNISYVLSCKFCELKSQLLKISPLHGCSQE